MHDPVAIRKLLQDPELSATVVHAIIRKLYGEAAYEWDLVTVCMEVQDDYRINMDSNVSNRWAAIQTIMTTDAFFTRLDAFLAICNTLSTGNPYFMVFDPVTTEEAAWGISEVSLNREMLPFAYPIKQYVGQILKSDGYAGDGPSVFDYVLEPNQQDQTLRDLLKQLYRTPNDETVEIYVNDQLRDMVSQFNQIASMASIDDILLDNDKATLVEAL